MDFFKKHAGALSAALLGLLAVCTVFAYERQFYVPDRAHVFMMLSDGFFIAALLFLLIACLLVLAYLGLFDWVAYLFARLFRRADLFSTRGMKDGKRVKKRRLDYYDYKSTVRHEKRGYRAMFLAFGLCLAAALLFLLLHTLI